MLSLLPHARHHYVAPPWTARQHRSAALGLLSGAFFRRRSVSQRPFKLSILFDAKVCRLLLKIYNRLLCQQIFKGMLNSGSRLIA
jgi:hypothetical protein